VVDYSSVYLRSDAGLIEDFAAIPASSLKGLEVANFTGNEVDTPWTLDIWGMPANCGAASAEGGGVIGVKCGD
jgi:hypothetical protein